MTDNNINKNEYSIERYPKTNNQSLKAWSAADEYLLEALHDLELLTPMTSSLSLAILNDRFGFLSCHFHQYTPTIVLNYKSQEKSIHQNLAVNQLDINPLNFLSPLTPLPSQLDIATLKIPKSLDLFKMQLWQISSSLKEDGIVVASFMTKYFSPQILSIAQEFFEVVEQSKARKKSRYLTLQKKKPQQEISIRHAIDFQNFTYQQYFGVFSAKNIDYASQFFIPFLTIKEENLKVLDLASGNGVLSRAIQIQNRNSEIHLMDDSLLAIESSRLNLNHENTFFHESDTMDVFEDNFFDLVISNPPFHFEHETNIEVAIRLFHGVRRCLKNDGKFKLVASRHLNFKTHLTKIFKAVNIIAENKKFVVYECL